MKYKKSLLSKIVMTTFLPVIFVYFATVVISMVVGNQNAMSFSDVQNKFLLIWAIGLSVIVGVSFLSIKMVSNRITSLTAISKRLVTGDAEVIINKNSYQDQLGELEDALAGIAENIKYQSSVVYKLAEGDLSKPIIPKSEKDMIGNSIFELQREVGKLFDLLERMPEYLKKEGYIDDKANENLNGKYKINTVGIIRTINELARRTEFYMAVLDAMPYQISVMDINLKRIFINKTLEDTMKNKGSRSTAEIPREAFYGNDCSQWQLQMCNTENCGVAAFKKTGRVEYPYEYNGEHFRMDTTDIKNKKGEVFGYVEMFFNTTATMSVNHYLKTEIQRLANNLKYLAEGNLEFDVDIQETNEFTIEVSEQFRAIENNLRSVKESISNLIGDTTMLTQAVMEGNLDTRAVETEFDGSWKELISGMNRILGETAKPLDEVAKVMHEIAKGNLNIAVYGDYCGSFDTMKQAVNTMGSEFKTIIKEISVAITEIGNGNLNLENIRAYKGDFNAISKAINVIITMFNSLMADINHAAEQVNVGANQVSDSSQSLAQGTTEQASSIQELTASINEIADRTKHNAIDANEAQELAKAVMDNAQKGNSQMLKMQRSMIEINKSSEDISKIIKVIDDIAFQTNILALNAAVEAARAGQHGRGFAVVAEEVRSLAARSAEAARVTTSLIEGTIGKVQEGTRITTETAEALDEIVGGISKVNDLFGNIAEASNEQAIGIVQINMGVEQVANVVQQNAATAEESAAASEELSNQSELLKEMIEQFKLR